MLMGRDTFPPCLSFHLGLLSPYVWGQIFFRMAASRELSLMINPETSAPNVLTPHTEPQLLPAFPGDAPRPAGMSDPDSNGVLALPRDPVNMESCVPNKIGLFVSPVLWSSFAQAPLALKSKCSRGCSSQYHAPRLRKLT